MVGAPKVHWLSSSTYPVIPGANQLLRLLRAMLYEMLPLKVPGRVPVFEGTQ
jgi:hypothetical protein